jgi:hypothetical protein
MWYWGHPQPTQVGLATSYGPVLTAEVHFDPTNLNLRSRGNWLTAYIELPDNCNVTDINITSIVLNSTIPAESSPIVIGDNDNDGIQDLMVKFNRTALVQYLISQRVEFANVPLTLNGQLKDGTLFEGNGTIQVSSLMGDVNCDGKVDIRDFVLGLLAFGSRPGECRWNDNANFIEPWDIINLADLVKIACHYGQHYT